MKRMRTFFRYLFRVDIFNRIIVFLSLVLALILPSWILYSLKEVSPDLTLAMPSLLVLGMAIGTGIFTLYKPIRTSWFYFLTVILVYAFNSSTFYEIPLGEIPTEASHALYVVGLVYHGGGFLLNAIFFLASLYRYKKSASAFNEETNNDSPYDFLNAKDINHDVERSVMKTLPKNASGDIVRLTKHVKFSRYARLVSFLAVLPFVIYVLASKDPENSYSFATALLAVFLLPILFLSSLFLPGDFKYLFYYQVIVSLSLFIIAARHDELSLFWLVLVLVLVVLALLSTLITEGRTWTGAEPDQK